MECPRQSLLGVPTERASTWPCRKREGTDAAARCGSRAWPSCHMDVWHKSWQWGRCHLCLQQSGEGPQEMNMPKSRNVLGKRVLWGTRISVENKDRRICWKLDWEYAKSFFEEKRDANISLENYELGLNQRTIRFQSYYLLHPWFATGDRN